VRSPYLVSSVVAILAALDIFALVCAVLALFGGAFGLSPWRLLALAFAAFFAHTCTWAGGDLLRHAEQRR
jgi:hypothetical protein